MAGITLSGLSTGLDTQTMVTQLMAVESQPRTRMQQAQTVEKARQTAFQQLSTKLSTLQTAAQSMRDVGLYALDQAVSSADPAKIAARRVSGAGTGGYEVTVSQLARAEQRTYAYTPPVADDTLTVGATTINVTAGMALDDLVTSINTNADAPVAAANVDGKLVLSSRTTGLAGGFTATGAAFTEDLSKLRAGQDAAYTVDGVAGTSSSNVITNGVAGIELTLKGTTTSPVSITVAPAQPDQQKIKDKLQAFVTAYNDVVDFARGKLGEEIVKNPTSDAQRAQGALRSDPQLRGVLSTLRTVLGSTIPGGTLTNLADLGVTTGAVAASGINREALSGKLTIDSAKLTAAFDKGTSAVQRVLAGTTDAPGIARLVETTLRPMVGTGGAVSTRIDASTRSITDYTNRMADIDVRLALRRKALEAQFTRMETLVSQNQSALSQVSAQIAKL